MLAERVFVSAQYCSVPRRVFLRPGRRSFQVFAKDVFGGARLSGNFGEADDGGLGEPSAMNSVNGDGLFFGGTLEDDGVQVLDTARQFRGATQGVIQFLDFLVQGCGALEIELLAGALAFLLERIAQRAPADV